MAFEDLIFALDNLGVADILLPFILIFTIVFAAMQKTKILGEKKQFHVVVALVIALSVVIPHVLGTYPAGYDVVVIMNEVLPQVSLIAVAFLTVLLLAGIVGVEIAGTSISFIFVLLSIVAVAAIFGGSLGWWQSAWFYNTFGEEAVSLVVMILVFGLIIWFISRDETTPGKTMMEGIKELFKK